MNLAVRGVGVSLTPSLERYAREKLTRPIERLMSHDAVFETITVSVELKRETVHHRKGILWRAAANVQLPEGWLYAEARADELHAAIDLLEEELERKLSKFKGRLRSRFLRGARQARELIRFHRLARFLWRGRRRRNEGL